MGFHMPCTSSPSVMFPRHGTVIEKCVNDAWGKLWPESAHNFKGLKNVVLMISKEILVIARHVGFIE
jgi:hypothetical protein